jgi:RNA polymerase sigma-70 factor, ECF subfamily
LVFGARVHSPHVMTHPPRAHGQTGEPTPSMSPPDPGTDARVAEFIRLFTSHEVRLRTLALSLVPDWNDAEEVVQQASIVMWRKFDRFTPGTNFNAWAAKIVHLTAKDYRKRSRRNVPSFGDRVFDLVAREAVLAGEELAERERYLHECMAKLKPRQRELLRLKYEEGFSGDQMARATSASVDAIYEALARIRRSLFECVNRRLRRAGT